MTSSDLSKALMLAADAWDAASSSEHHLSFGAKLRESARTAGAGDAACEHEWGQLNNAGLRRCLQTGCLSSKDEYSGKVFEAHAPNDAAPVRDPRLVGKWSDKIKGHVEVYSGNCIADDNGHMATCENDEIAALIANVLNGAPETAPGPEVPERAAGDGENRPGDRLDNFAEPIVTRVADPSPVTPAPSPGMDALDRVGLTNERAGSSQGRCETTLTERFHNPACKCKTYPGNLGPCKTFDAAAHCRCVYCDHTLECHQSLAGIIAPSAPQGELRALTHEELRAASEDIGLFDALTVTEGWTKRQAIEEMAWFKRHWLAQATRTPSLSLGGTAGATEDEFDFQLRMERERGLKRFAELHHKIPGNGLYVEGDKDDSFTVGFHEVDAGDNGPVQFSESLIEGEAVSEHTDVVMLAEYLSLAVEIAADVTVRKVAVPPIQTAEHPTEKITPVTLRDCPPGLFSFNGTLGFKSEYLTESKSHPGAWQSDAYCVSTGEYFWGGTTNPSEREKLLVEPVRDLPQAFELTKRGWIAALDRLSTSRPAVQGGEDAVREECAKIVEGFMPDGPDPIGPLHGAGRAFVAKQAAAAIRLHSPAPVGEPK